MANQGWFKAMRSEDALELIRARPLAYVLASVIARRARWREGFNADEIEHGEALLGDYNDYGMTRQQYRSALKFLVKWEFITIRITNKGTIAKLTDTRLFDVLNLTGNHPNNQQPTTTQPSPDQQLTTNEEGKKAKQEINYESIKAQPAIKDLYPQLTELLQDARDILGEDEMKRCHKRWYERAVTDPDKLQRVLADVRTEKQHRKIENPGAYAEDLWKRFYSSKS